MQKNIIMSEQKFSITALDEQEKVEEKKEEIKPEKKNIETQKEETKQELTFDEVVKQKFSDVESFNKFFNEYEQLKTEAETLRSKLPEFETKATTYEKKLKEYEEAGYIDDETYYKLAKLKKSNPEKAKQIEKVLFGGISNHDLLRMKFVEENPTYADKQEYIETVLEEEYGIGMQLPDEEDDNYNEILKKKRVKEMKLNAESEKYKQQIISQLDTIEVAKPKTEADSAKEKEAYLSSWQKPFDSISKNIESLNIEVDSENGEKKKLYEYKLTETEKKEQLKLVAEVINSGRYDTTEDNIESFVELAKKDYIAKNIGTILQKALGEAEKKIREEVRSKNSTEKIKNSDAKPVTDVKDPKLKAYYSAMGY